MLETTTALNPSQWDRIKIWKPIGDAKRSIHARKFSAAVQS